MKKKLFVDFDNTIVDSIDAIVSLYNEDFKYYKNFKHVHSCNVTSYDFKELTLATKDYIDGLWTQPRFFKRLKFIYEAKEALSILKRDYDIYIVTMGYFPNLVQKRMWIAENLPFVKDIICIDLYQYQDKSNVDMKNQTVLDDDSKMLRSTNAAIKIMFGDVCEWNKDWDGMRCYNWPEVISFLKNMEQSKEFIFKKHPIILTNVEDMEMFSKAANEFIDDVELIGPHDITINAKSFCNIAKIIHICGFPFKCDAVLYSDNPYANKIFNSYVKQFKDTGGDDTK